jgi:microcystin-dependent protein
LDTTIKDFRVTIDGVIVSNTLFTKTSPTVITYTGGDIGATPLPVSVVRATPIERVAPLIGYGSRLSTTSYEGELNRLHRIAYEVEERLRNVEAGGGLNGSPVVNESITLGNWGTDFIQTPARANILEALNFRVLQNNGSASNLSITSTYPDTEDSDKAVYASWVRTRINNAINTWSNGTPTVSTPPLSFGNRVVNADYLHSTALPAGCVVAYAGNGATPGWLDCNGQAVSRTTYSRLFAAIGTIYGAGDGSTTFNLPNLNTTPNRVIAGVGTNTNLTTGDDTKTVPLPQHSHSVNLTTGTQSTNHTHGYQGNFNAIFGQAVGGSGTFVVSTSGGTAHGLTNLLTESANHTHTVSGNTANTGTAGASIDVRQPTLYMKYRISTGGQ